MIKAQVHRFGDCVALYVGTGQTVYVTPADAKCIAKTLNRAATDVTQSTFQNSKFTTTKFDFADHGLNGRGFKIVREGNDK